MYKRYSIFDYFNGFEYLVIEMLLVFPVKWKVKQKVFGLQ